MRIVKMFEADNLDKCPRFTGEEGVHELKRVNAALWGGMVAFMVCPPGENREVITIARMTDSLLDEPPPPWFFGGWQEIDL